jgi:hypothetical protein
MDHTQTLDLVVVDAVLDKVEVALGLVDRAGQELNDALLLEPGADGLEHIEALLHRASAGLRCELKIAGRSGHGVPAQSGIKSPLHLRRVRLRRRGLQGPPEPRLRRPPRSRRVAAPPFSPPKGLVGQPAGPFFHLSKPLSKEPSKAGT